MMTSFLSRHTIRIYFILFFLLTLIHKRCLNFVYIFFFFLIYTLFIEKYFTITFCAFVFTLSEYYGFTFKELNTKLKILCNINAF